MESTGCLELEVNGGSGFTVGNYKVQISKEKKIISPFRDFYSTFFLFRYIGT